MLSEAQQQHQRVVRLARVRLCVHAEVDAVQVGVNLQPQLRQVGVLARLAELLDAALVRRQRAQLVAQQARAILCVLRGVRVPAGRAQQGGARLQGGHVSTLVCVGQLAQQVLVHVQRLAHVRGHRAGLVVSGRQGSQGVDGG